MILVVDKRKLSYKPLSLNCILYATSPSTKPRLCPIHSYYHSLSSNHIYYLKWIRSVLKGDPHFCSQEAANVTYLLVHRTATKNKERTLLLGGRCRSYAHRTSTIYSCMQNDRCWFLQGYKAPVEGSKMTLYKPRRSQSIYSTIQNPPMAL